MHKHSNFIYKKYQKISKATTLEKELEILVLGEAKPINLIKDTKEYIKYQQSIITISSNSWNKESKELFRATLYKNLAPTLLNSKVEYWADSMNLKPTKVSYRKTKRQWGSCSYKNSISLNTFLVMLPPKIIDYIIVHELAHITHKNHSKEFWALVEKYLPEYKDLRKELKIYSPFLN